MSKTKLAEGVVHKVPADLRVSLFSAKAALSAWEDITPLARNEWICWVMDAKKPETRAHRIERARAELMEGIRRPCCWAGCVHRTDKPVSPSVRAILNRRSKKQEMEK